MKMTHFTTSEEKDAVLKIWTSISKDEEGGTKVRNLPLSKIRLNTYDYRPLFRAEGAEQSITVGKLRLSMVTDADMEDTEVSEALKEVPYFIDFPEGGMIHSVPITVTAYNQLLERCGLNCKSFSGFEDKARLTHMPAERKMEIIMEFLQLQKAKFNLIIRKTDEGGWKAISASSQEYAYLPADEMVRGIEGALKQKFKNSEFAKGDADDDFLFCDFTINDPRMSAKLLQLYRNVTGNTEAETADIYCRFQTSDSCSSASNAYFYVDFGDMIAPIGNNISMKHIGDASVESFVESFEKVDVNTTGLERKVENLGNIEINDLKKVVETVAKQYDILRDTQCKTVLNALPVKYPTNKGSAMTVYLILNEIFTASLKSSRKSVASYIDAVETFYKFLNYGDAYKAIDEGEKEETWKKLLK